MTNDEQLLTKRAEKHFNWTLTFFMFGIMLITLNSALADPLTNNQGGPIFFFECLVYVLFLIIWNKTHAGENTNAP